MLGADVAELEHGRSIGALEAVEGGRRGDDCNDGAAVGPDAYVYVREQAAVAVGGLQNVGRYGQTRGQLHLRADAAFDADALRPRIEVSVVVKPV